MIFIKKIDIFYPKSECLICPTCKLGDIYHGILGEVVENGNKSLKNNIDKYINENTVQLGDSFFVEPGRTLKYRKVKQVCCLIIKEYFFEYISLFDVKKYLENCLKKNVEKKIKSVTMPSMRLGYESDSVVLANVMFDVVKKYKNVIDINIFDLDDLFINTLIDISKGINNVKFE